MLIRHILIQHMLNIIPELRYACLRIDLPGQDVMDDLIVFFGKMRVCLTRFPGRPSHQRIVQRISGEEFPYACFRQEGGTRSPPLP
jgi:hypothetical protein